MRRKILFVIPTLDRCGAEKQLTLLAAGLPRDQFDARVAVLTRSGPYLQTLRDANVRVDVIGKHTKISLRAYWKLLQLIREFQPDVVHTWLFAANAYGRRAAFAAKTPVVICGERCCDPWKGMIHDWIDRTLAPKTDFFAVNSVGIVDFYAARGLPREKFVVIPNAVEPPTLPSQDERERLRNDLLRELNARRQKSSASRGPKNAVFEKTAIAGSKRTDEQPFIIGLIARLWPQKRVRDALWSADQLKFAQKNFYLLIVGDGPDRNALLRYRDDLELGDRVIFLGERNDVSKLIPAFDLLWNCSAYEGQSNAILEAQSFCVPTIASDIPGNRDLVETGKNGLLISEFDGDETRRKTAFSRETIRLMQPENANVLRQWGENARRRVLEDFSPEKMIERYVELYERAIASKR